MSKITDITLQTKNKNRANLHLDGKFFCGLQLEAVLKHNLKIGQEIDEETLNKLIQKSEEQVAFNKALNLISKRLKTKKQVQDYLLQKGFMQEVVSTVIEKLQEYRYIDDASFANTYIQLNMGTKGVRRLRQDLFQKGIDKKTIEAALSSLPEQTEQILVLKQKYMKNKEHSQKTLANLYSYLLRRGFTQEQIKANINFKVEE